MISSTHRSDDHGQRRELALTFLRSPDSSLPGRSAAVSAGLHLSAISVAFIASGLSVEPPPDLKLKPLTMPAIAFNTASPTRGEVSRTTVRRRLPRAEPDERRAPPREVPTALPVVANMEIDSSEAESALAGIDDPSIPGQGVGSGIGGGASWRSPPPAVAVEPAPAPPRVVVLKEARLVERVAPVYPNVAVAAGISGQVILEALVDPNGRVAAVDVILGHRLFEQAARDAVLRWRYEPLLLNGVPTPFRLTVTVHFRLR